MKKFFWLSLIFCFFNTSTFASKRVAGQVIYSNDTVTVTFLISTYGKSENIDYPKLQDKVKFFDSSGKKYVLRPDKALEIRFKYQGKLIRMVSIPKKDWFLSSNLFSKNIFLRIISDGKIKMYSLYKPIYIASSVQTMNGTMSVSQKTNKSDSYIVVKIGDKIFRPSELLNFKERIVEFLSDCPELIKTINERNMNIDYLPWIINEYNRKCGNQ
jgi:hypothetical protein